MKIDIRKLNQLRTLTMTNNRGNGTLVIDYGKEDTTIMCIKKSNNKKDVFFIRKLSKPNFKAISDYAYDLSKEFKINKMIINICGFGQGFYDYFSENYISDYPILKIRQTTKSVNESWIKLLKDIDNGDIRFLKSVDFAKYDKPFLGMSDVLKSHRHTDTLIEQIENININIEKGQLNPNVVDSKITNSMINCLTVYYSHQCDYSNCIVEDELDFEGKTRLCDYIIASSTLKKGMLKSIKGDTWEDILVICPDSITARRIIQIIKEPEFDKFNPYISEKQVRDGFLVYDFINGSRFTVVQESAVRGMRGDHAVIDKKIKNITCDSIDIINMDF